MSALRSALRRRRRLVGKGRVMGRARVREAMRERIKVMLGRMWVRLLRRRMKGVEGVVMAVGVRII
jgi:hypothetical protein